jgi:DNA helicase-2/ATP-dependent DNA helicase PcrA
MTASDPFSLDDEPQGPSSVSVAPLPFGGGEPPWLDGLNPEQRQAVTTTDGPLLVLSGAGTGKTRVLTTRLAHLIGLRLAQPWQCLAVTFTNRAAKEMRDRLSGMIGGPAESVWLGTFHAICVRMLRRHAEVVGLKSGFLILDTDDQMRVLKQLMEGTQVDTKKWPPQAIMGVIQRWKDRGLAPDKVPADDARSAGGGTILTLYTRYQDRLRELNACDFGDLLLHCLTLFQSHYEILEEYQDRFRYILVDEYQDTNVAQYLWLRLLARKHRNICCVGDDDQSIYSWRGAEVGNILRFETDFPGAVVVRLERNYRSTPTILKAASHLIRNNQERLGKELRSPGVEDEGPKVCVRGVWSADEEARWVVEEIESLHGKGAPLSGMAVLVRAGFQTREFEERLITTGLPYRVIGGPRFYERMEIRDALAYLRLLVSPDDDLAFERVVNKPKRGLGDATIQTLHISARALGKPLYPTALELIETDELKPKPRSALRDFCETIERFKALVDVMDLPELVKTLMEESGYAEMWRRDKSPEAPGRLENLDELYGAVDAYDGLAQFLEHISLVMENEARAAEDPGVTLMTLHAAKGLEFDVVFLPGWEEEIFPHKRALEEGGMAALEEERRLAYVGITRARKRVFISFAASRRIFGQWVNAIPSRFLEELPPDCVEAQSESGLYGAGFAESGGAWGGAWDDGWGGRQRSSKVIPGDGSSYAVKPREAEDGLAVGVRVFHQKFGYGVIQRQDGDKLAVQFDKAGLKKVLGGFVERA